MAKDFIKTWNGKRLDDWGPEVSKEFKSFQSAMKREVKRLAEENGATLASWNNGHYDMSGFVERDGLYVYFSYSNLDRCKVSLTPDGGWHTSFLMRTAKGPKDYHGGTNNNVAFSQFSETLQRLFRGAARMRNDKQAGVWKNEFISSEGFKFELLLFDWGVHARISKDGVLLYHNERWPGTFDESYDIYEASRQMMMNENSDIYEILREKVNYKMKQAA